MKKNSDTKVAPTSNKNSPIGLKKDNFPVFDFNNKQIDTVVLNKATWSLAVDEDLVHQVVVAQQASLRQGTKKVKDRGEVSGGGKKPWRQKGTGRARHGSIRSPIWRGGGVTFGPSGQENYQKKINRKVFRLALKMIFSDCLKNKKLIFCQNDDLVKPSTKKFLSVVKTLCSLSNKIVVVLSDKQPNLMLSARNVPKTKVLMVHQINPYDFLVADKILIFKETLPLIEQRLN